jgi:hypothetical protein
LRNLCMHRLKAMRPSYLILLLQLLLLFSINELFCFKWAHQGEVVLVVCIPFTVPVSCMRVSKARVVAC